MGWFGSKWVVVRTESGSRVDDIDRLDAIFKSNGMKTKISLEGSSIKRIQVRKKDVDRAKELMQIFDDER
ncbi:hypothetical protein A7K91_06760 [Paenibacillus oryzae]|uniref:DUF2007 domain-containing protein n=1 Tax=Paenibacillus oryzae TaxID=1844972 RepID=A0A1A5YDG6_9BACL|nr:hypothetical protein [Paenibacillus oryzae]OBR63638.1 hypothetical protein A7K91_06760 [Paenibacillus oryzae]